MRQCIESRMTYPPGREDQWVGDDIKGLYRHDAMRNPMLSSERIAELVNEIQAGAAAAKKLETSKHITKKARAELTQASIRGIAARNSVVEANTGLVFCLAEKYRGQGLDEMDLMQEGNFGLIRAAELYDPNNAKKAEFGTYAAIWIRSSISKAIHRQGRMIQVPVDHSTTLQKMRTIEREHISQTGQKIPEPELLVKMNEGRNRKPLIEADISELRSMEWNTTSYNQEIINSEGRLVELGDYLSDPTEPSVEEYVAQSMDADEIQEMIEKMLANSSLNPYQKEVAWLYFAEGQSVETIASLLSRNQQSVIHTAKAALKKLQFELAEGGSMDYFRSTLLKHTTL